MLFRYLNNFFIEVSKEHSYDLGRMDFQHEGMSPVHTLYGNTIIIFKIVLSQLKSIYDVIYDV